ETSQKECLELINTSHKLGTSNVIITRGKKGALFSNGKNIYEQPSIETKVVDTLGAGDSFIAKFLIQFHLTNNPKLSLKNFAINESPAPKVSTTLVSMLGCSYIF